ncbi:Epidermal growth factor receptor kinase substrate 8-like protein 2 [Gryllus bimaculatus]|nr:Epidermal growth factor receptor kinase substrate 8-like protein 2 [Gryllus bimaculatus]
MYPPRDRNLNDETSSTSSEKYERDVTILNHCFDDIEKFIARLQHAAAASRELERRRRSRKSKKKDLGDGMLTMRAKPPPEVDFIDIFQKFKLSFNLLAKLKAHIHDPNAPELVHFLFTPLALIVDASHDTHYGPNLPAKVVSPLLSREAVNLLINCVTSKETELWQEQWKYFVDPYHPKFTDGWIPEFPVGDEKDPLALPSPPEDKRAGHEPDLPEQHYHREPERDDSHYSSDYFDYEQQEASPPDGGRYHGGRPERYRDERERSQSPGGSEHDFPLGPPMSSVPVTSRDISARSDISADSIERNGGGESQQRFERAQSRWLEELRSRGAKIVQVTYPRTANNDKELTVIRGEYLEVVDDSRKWWKARNSRGHVAHVPHTIVTPYQPGGGEPGDVFSEPLHPGRGYDRHYPGQDSPRDSGTTVDGRPTRSPPIPPPAPADWVRKKHLGKKDDPDLSSDEDGLPVTSRSNAPPPPPLPAPGAISAPSSPKLTRSKSNSNLTRNTSSTDLEMQEELKNVLTMFRNKRRNLDIVRTPEVYIDPQSSPEDVKKWLKDKGFSDDVCKRLNGMSGNELFDLNREQLEKYCGIREGRRLDSQLTIQRNVSGYKTARSSELRAILAKVRSKVETPTPPEKPSSGNLKASPPPTLTQPPTAFHPPSPRPSPHPPSPRPPSPRAPTPPAPSSVSPAPPPHGSIGRQKFTPPPPPPPNPASLQDDDDDYDDTPGNTSTLGDLLKKQRLKMQNRN